MSAPYLTQPLTSWCRMLQLVCVLLLVLPAGVNADHSTDPGSVAIVGSLQSELGCPGDWQPECAATDLAYDAEDEVWQGSFNVPAGSWEYKATLNDSWDESHGANGSNITLNLGAPTDVKFYYDHETHWVTDNVNARIVTAVGSWQDEVGCFGDWRPDCLRAWLQDPDGDGIFTLETDQIPAGSYEVKATIDEDWAENYGAGGVAGGANILFDVAGNETVLFTFRSATNVLTVSTPGPATYAIIHYYRADGDYGDHTTGDFNNFWGLHLWGDAIDPSEGTEWTSPKPFLGETEYGRFAWIKLAPGGGTVNYIVHRGDTKDGSGIDRSFDVSTNPEIWLKAEDDTGYSNQAAAQGFATVRYHRADGDYGNPLSPDYNDFWGLHLWGDAIDPSEGTDWTNPKRPSGTDDYGVYWNIQLQDPSQALNFIIHRGDNKDPGPDQSVIPSEVPTAWVQSGDVEIYAQRGAAEDYARLHYHRPGSDYGDYTSTDFNDFWGLHVWTGAASANPPWDNPVRPAGFDIFGPFFDVALLEEATELAYILHRGDNKDPGPDQFLNLALDGYDVWQVQGANPEVPYVLPIRGAFGGNAGDLRQQQAYWLDEKTLAWGVAGDPDLVYTMHYAADSGLTPTAEGITGGTSVELLPGTLSDEVKAKFPHLADLPALELPPEVLPMVPEILRGQFAVSALNADGKSVDATGLQIPGVLDDLYTYAGELGPIFDDDAPTLKLWAPTAKNVNLLVFDDADPATTPAPYPMNLDYLTGVWSLSVNADWNGKYYLYDVTVYAPSTGQVENNMVTDPYSYSLAMNSSRSQIIDLDDAALKPSGWDSIAKPSLAAPEDISIYELHVRDFSANDPSVPDALKGTYKAFTLDGSNGTMHLGALAASGLTHVHLLPVFDIASVNENRAEWQAPDPSVLELYPPDSEQQQAEVTAYEDLDGFNWGYDPWHYTAPEGSYATDPDGTARVLEFREMVQSLNETGLRVVMDVVYNHTNSAGQNEKSVLDKIVPGYYHRLNDRGEVETSSCCANTATEHNMMEKLMIDSLVTWAREYKVDAFRFDLMGHHTKSNILNARAAIDDLTLADDGVEGFAIYLYGEGWNFGEVADNARFIQATQANMAGTGVGSFNDRVRDGVRGGGPFSGLKEQGFATGLFYDSNGEPQGDELSELLRRTDWIRVTLTGNLANYVLEDRFGNEVPGSAIDYQGQAAGYTLDPQEIINYASAHDNETLFDAVQLKASPSNDIVDRVRAHNMGLSVIALGQGVPFFHAGSDLLRSKSMDRDSFNSGDWFNRLDFTYQDNNWGGGLPVAGKNADNWPLMSPLLADPALDPDATHIRAAVDHFQEMLQIRRSSPLFRLQTEGEVSDRLAFHNTGSSQIPGLIVMSLSDDLGSVDPGFEKIVVLFNAKDDAESFSRGEFEGVPLALHPVQAVSNDLIARDSVFDMTTGTFDVAGRTTAVFVVSRDPIAQIDVIIDTIEDLLADGTVNGGQANSLIRKLENVQSRIDRGQINPAINQLHAFINQVSDFVATGVLSMAQGDALIAAASNVIADLES